MITITFVRHGESLDNLRSVWAGWKDAPLSNHGMNQARALGASLSHIPFAAIYASDLLRAHHTALALHAAQTSPPPPVVTSPLFREQHFGIAEGKEWTLSGEPDFEKGIFPVLYESHEKFPGGESLDDLVARAEKAVKEIIMPHVWEAAKSRIQENKGEVNIAVVSHGLCISELLPAVLKYDVRTGSRSEDGSYRGLMNTAWTRVRIDLLDDGEVDTTMEGWESRFPLAVTVTDHNRHEHINNVKRQKGIGSAAHDPKQKDIRAFFGGASPSATSGSIENGEAVEAQEHSESNAGDEVDVEIKSD